MREPNNSFLLQEKRNLRSLEYWEKKRYWVWIFGLLLRICFTPFTFYDADYRQFRLPVATGLADGKGLYNEVYYNQMPVYPYISVLMILLVGTDDVILTRMALKFPQAVADACIPVFLYKLGKLLDRRREGLLSSLTYSINPYSLYEISNATFHSIASLFLLMAIYFLCKNRSLLVGLLLSLGFLVSQYPLFAFGFVFIYYREKKKEILKVIFSFSLTTIIILGLVLIPFDTTLDMMISDLRQHEIYNFRVLNATQIIHGILNYFLPISSSLWSKIWAIFFGILMIIPLLFYLKYPVKSRMIEVITMQITLLSIFFISNHSKHTIWLLPWLLFWSFTKKRNNPKTLQIYAPIFVFLGYFLRRMRHRIPGDFFIGSLVLGIAGIWIIYTIIADLKENPDRA